ncbi:HAMP domain-containing histidine kinase [Microbispora sp. NEAU-D428]|uniref:sensor histidine kinase n=1 Tax=Microbispora sitophila TaxID=2771537 RepID=UPI001867C53E|nr:HAMP domain-containing sensor histidine kinase [Microbispora sitophila]MBE3014628.1 HAMP domain-containing histidine kinase [Microbispora sitophila]
MPRPRPPARWSVRLRATVAATAIVAVALGGAAAVLTAVLRASLEQSTAAQAHRRAAQVAAVLAVPASPAAGPYGSPGTHGQSGTQESEPPERSLSGAAAEKGTSVSDPDVRVGVPAETPGADWAGDGYLTARTTVETGEGPLTVVARTSLEPAREALATLGRLLVFGIPALLLVVAAMTWFSVGRALAPVSAIRAELADITTRDLHRRVPVPGSGDEIAALAGTVNATLDRLENAVRQHKRFVADAAHELRSPIATVRTRLELASGHEPAREALADVGRLQALAADLLLLAALDAGEPPRADEVDLGQVAAEEALRPRPETGVTVRVTADPDVVVHGSRHHLARLVTNLVDNAVRHASSAVEVRVLAEKAGALLEVRDDGPGIPPEDREAVFDRFTRLDDARTRDAGGSGLGLAIVREIAARHGGIVVIGDSPGGGACFTVRLPAQGVFLSPV